MTRTHLDERDFAPGEKLTEQGEPAMEAFLIESGRVRVSMERQGRSATLAELGPGEIVGESALFKGSDYGASVEAVEPTRAVVITPDILDAKIAACDPMIRALIRMLMVRLRRTSQALAGDGPTG